MNLILAVFLFLSPAHAGWLKDFCERHIVADDPYPYAEYGTKDLVAMYEASRDRLILKELIYRFDIGLADDEERALIDERVRR
jgi:hypothetical protein